MKSKVRSPKSEVQRADRKHGIRRAGGFFAFGAGCVCIWLCLYGFQRLLHLMEDEGTESWTVNAGPLGITGCGLFLAIVFFAGVSQITCAIHLFTKLNPANSCART